MLKIAGILLIIATGAAVGIMQARKLSNRVTFFEDYICVITEIQSNISYSAAPLSEIIDNIHSRKSISPFLNKLKDFMCSDISFREAWTKTVYSFDCGGCLSDDDKKLINDFGLGLGTTDIDGQVAHCKLSLTLAADRLNLYRNEKLNKGKLYRTLGVLTGAAVGLLII